MADENPGTDVSSYSDPIYDRLEGVNRALAKNWRLIVIVILAVVGTLTFINNQTATSPDAISASAYNQAAGDSDKLKALAANADILPEFRFQAANDLVQKALDDGKIEDAQQYLSVASEQAQASGSEKLKVYALVSKAAMQSEAGEIEAAINSYGEAISLGRNSTYKAAIYLAQFNKAQLQVRAANSSEDKDAALELRRSALNSFDQMRSGQGSAKDLNNSRLQQAAEYSYYNLLRSFPELAIPSLPADVVTSAMPEIEKVEATPVTDAAPAEAVKPEAVKPAE